MKHNQYVNCVMPANNVTTANNVITSNNVIPAKAGIFTWLRIPAYACMTLMLFVTSCSPKVENRGYVKQIPWKESVKVGQTSRQEVLEKFGSPSSKSRFGEETWYYISDRKEAVAFFRPEIVEQEAAYIKFDASGVVKDVGVYDKSNAKDFALVNRTTPTEGHSMGFVDQVLGNIGRFNKPGGTEGVATGGRRPAGRGGF